MSSIQDYINSKKNMVCSECKERNFHINLTIRYEGEEPFKSCGDNLEAWCGNCDSECDLIERPKEEDVCCVGCGIRICGFDEEPPFKDERDEAVCYECCEDQEEEVNEDEKKIIEEAEKNRPKKHKIIWEVKDGNIYGSYRYRYCSDLID